MPDLKILVPLGGGIGDVWFDWLHDRQFAKVPSLVRDYGATVRVVTQCHCTGVEDLFRYCPYVHEVVVEEWHMPCPEDAVRWNSISEDGYIPVGRNDLLHAAGVTAICMRAPQLFLARSEELLLADLLQRRPTIVAQPYAGLSDRDGFDPDAIARLARDVSQLSPEARILVIGRNHERGHKYSQELCPEGLGNVVNLIDRLDIRVAYHLVARCDAFVGAHSNLIRAAWDYRRRTALVVPDPSMTRHLPTMDRKYTYGLQNPECRLFSYPFDTGQERRFDQLDTAAVARFALRGE